MKNKTLLSVLAVALFSLGIAACGPTSEPTTEGGDVPTTSAPAPSAEESTTSAKVIQSITVQDEYKSINVTVGDVLYDFTEYYTIKPSGLSSKQKKVKISIVDGADCFAEDDGMFEAIKSGTATFQITSNVNPDIFDTMQVVVQDAYFERNSVADLTHELPENGGYVTVDSDMTTDIFVKTEATTKYYYETTIKFSSTAASEYFPKIGLRVETVADGEYSNNAFVWFLDFPCSADEHKDGSYYTKTWNNFGICEISKGEGWAWNPGVNNATARHSETVYRSETGIKAEQEFTMGMARDGNEFYLFAEGVMAAKFVPLNDLIAADTPTKFGFFEFNTSATFSKYSYTVDAAEVDAKIADFKAFNPFDAWAAD